MKFYIVTPSYNQLDWLKLCVASVADQAAEGGANGAGRVEVHHYVQDAQSTDGTPEWLERYAQEVRNQRSEISGQYEEPKAKSLTPKAALSGCAYTFSYASEPDNGMYDAVNRGWEKAPADADIIAHLNCDEQYLPDALRNVAACFQKQLKDDVVFADMIVTDASGEYLCHRRPLPPWPVHSRLFLPGFTCTTFQRRSVFFEKGCRFDTSWKNLGDVVWYQTLIQKKCHFRMLDEYTSVFVYTGENLSQAGSADEERSRYKALLPAWLNKMRPAGLLLKRIRYIARMAFSTAPASYSLFLPGRSGRTKMLINKPVIFWPKERIGFSK